MASRDQCLDPLQQVFQRSIFRYYEVELRGVARSALVLKKYQRNGARGTNSGENSCSFRGAVLCHCNRIRVVLPLKCLLQLCDGCATSIHVVAISSQCTENVTRNSAKLNDSGSHSFKYRPRLQSSTRRCRGPHGVLSVHCEERGCRIADSQTSNPGKSIRQDCLGLRFNDYQAYH